MSQQELNAILDNHKKWLNDEDGGVRANLSGVVGNSSAFFYANKQEVNLMTCVNTALLYRHLRDEEARENEQEALEAQIETDYEELMAGRFVVIKGTKLEWSDVTLEAYERNDDWDEQLRLLANGKENKVDEYLESACRNPVEYFHGK